MRMKWEKNSKKTPSMQRCVGGWSNETTQLGTDKRPNALKHGLQGEGGYAHDGRAMMEYAYNGLCWFWNP